MPKALSLLGVLLLSHNLWAQKPFEGRIQYNITYDRVSAEMQGVDEMLPDRVTWIIDGSHWRAEYRFKLGGGYTLVHEEGKDSLYALTELPRATMYTASEFKDGGVGVEVVKTDLRGKKAGHAIRLYLVGSDSVWCSSKFANIEGAGFSELEYLPLEASIWQGDMRMHLRASSVRQEPVDETYFALPDYYERVSQEVFDSMLR